MLSLFVTRRAAFCEIHQKLRASTERYHLQLVIYLDAMIKNQGRPVLSDRNMVVEILGKLLRISFTKHLLTSLVKHQDLQCRIPIKITEGSYCRIKDELELILTNPEACESVISIGDTLGNPRDDPKNAPRHVAGPVGAFREHFATTC